MALTSTIEDPTWERLGPYGGEVRHSQLATRAEALISQEHARWVASQQGATARPAER